MKELISGIRWDKQLSLMLVVILCGILTACGSGSSTVATSKVTVKIGESPVRSDKTLDAIPTNVATILFTISAPDMGTISRSVPVSGQSSITETFEVPVGNERLFIVEAMDSAGKVLYRGQTYANLTGESVSLSISLSASNATVTITTDSTGRTTTVVTLASAATKVTIPAGTTLTDASGAPLTGSITATSAFSSNLTTLPTAAAATTPSQQVLTAYVDLNISLGGQSVKNINPPITVVINAGSVAIAGDKVDIYSFDAATGTWKYETSTVVASDNTIQMSVGHLSIWAAFKASQVTGSSGGSGTRL